MRIPAVLVAGACAALLLGPAPAPAASARFDFYDGGGHVIMIAGPAPFRLFWRSSERMLLNALLYAPAFQ